MQFRIVFFIPAADLKYLMGNSSTRERFRSASPDIEARGEATIVREARSASASPTTSQLESKALKQPHKGPKRKTKAEILPEVTKALEFGVRYMSNTPEVATPLYEGLDLPKEDRTGPVSVQASEHQMSFSENVDQ